MMIFLGNIVSWKIVFTINTNLLLTQIVFAVAKPEIIECLVKKRDAELVEWREKRRKACVENSAAAEEKAKESDKISSDVGGAAKTTTVSSFCWPEKWSCVHYLVHQ